MGALAATEAMPLHHTGEPSTLGSSDNIHSLADAKHVRADRVSNLWVLSLEDSHFAQHLEGPKRLARSSPAFGACASAAAALSRGRLGSGRLGLISLGLSRWSGSALLAGRLPGLGLSDLLPLALGRRLGKRMPKVPQLWALRVLEPGFSKPKLNRLITIQRHGLHLSYRTGTSLDDCDGNRFTSGAENLGHAYFPA
jgi:hypothetical protein